MSAERSFKKEIGRLRLGAGETFHGEGILAVTKALLQSGVAYVGGYQGAPVSHLIDVLVDADELMDELGIHVETCTNEASAAAMLGASLNYPLRGAVTWKSIVGTNVAADALSNLTSPGVKGGALIISGEDYGEGASVIQERTLAMAMKSTMWLLDPRPDLEKIVDTVEHAFALSEASNTPVIMELRIRACHIQGEFVAKDNVPPPVSTRHRLESPATFDYGRLAHPPVIFAQEKLKVEERLPAARKYIVEHQLNEVMTGDLDDVGIVLQGGLYNGLIRRLQTLGLADAFGQSRIPLLVLNVTHPLVPGQIVEFAAGKRGILVLEEGNPEYIEHQINTFLRKADVQAPVYGKDVLPPAGEYSAEVIQNGLAAFLRAVPPKGFDANVLDGLIPASRLREDAAEAIGTPLPPRPPTFCTGCPERPVFSALKILQGEVGKVHISADIGCHAFATFEPFSMGNSILGYGMSLASAAAVAPFQDRRSISIMGDGGFWHNGLASGVVSALLNRGDSILVIMQNGYTSATGQQFIPNSPGGRDGHPTGADIEATLKTLGVPWIRRVRTYSVSKMVDTLREALTTETTGLKVIVADGECQLARQRRLRAENAKKLEAGDRVVLPRFGVDDAICTGDHSCIRLSGCPSLTVKESPDPLRQDPVATVIQSCVGCGLCGEVAHAATLCPSFYRAERVRNAGAAERMVQRVRDGVIGLMQRNGAAR
jgi:indolepyruvate ferredoxin oxidoreductase alpha subunit